MTNRSVLEGPEMITKNTVSCDVTVFLYFVFSLADHLRYNIIQKLLEYLFLCMQQWDTYAVHVLTSLRLRFGD